MCIGTQKAEVSGRMLRVCSSEKGVGHSGTGNMNNEAFLLCNININNNSS